MSFQIVTIVQNFPSGHCFEGDSSKMPVIVFLHVCQNCNFPDCCHLNAHFVAPMFPSSETTTKYLVLPEKHSAAKSKNILFIVASCQTFVRVEYSSVTQLLLAFNICFGYQIVKWTMLEFQRLMFPLFMKIDLDCFF